MPKGAVTGVKGVGLKASWSLVRLGLGVLGLGGLGLGRLGRVGVA